ncbi:ferric-rhodotorulic acid outer membrane transporter [Salmonella enterica subsp. enterica]|nr:ferric-rhodotorulic acid outer membrane transporter [Salmonella enterica subsp. enterica] [Salmonella enterica subsp. enterica serovar Menston]
MSFIQYRRDKHLPSTAAPSLLAMGMAMAFMPAAFAAEDTVIVEGATTTDAVNREEQDYSMKTTAAGTKMPMTQRDIPQSVSIVSQQRMEDQQLQTLGEVIDQYAGDQAEVRLTPIASAITRAGLKLTTIWLTVFQRILSPAGIWAMR